MPDAARIAWDDKGRPWCRRFGDVYFSRSDGLAESRYVFLHNNHLGERWRRLPAQRPGTFTLAETGFGTGLNFLAAWDLWRQTAPAGWQLQFISVEKFPLDRADLAAALALWPQLQELATQLLEAYPAAASGGFHRRRFGPVALTLIVADAAAGLGQLLTADRHQAPVDAWLLDGFAPARNPDMWSPALFALIGRLSAGGTTAATFSAAGVVKRGLRSAGFEVEKTTGFGSKRDMLRARMPPAARPGAGRPAAAQPDTVTEPWLRVHSADRLAPGRRRALVIGGGLAGCHSARALARRGWQVTLLERGAELAAGASGNRQGILYARLSPTPQIPGEFNLAALLYAQHCYRPLWRRYRDIGRQCGVLQLAYSERVAAQQRALMARFGHYREFVRQLDAAAAAELAATPLPHPALYFPGAGWLRPAVLCRRLAAAPLIRVVSGCQVASLHRDGRRWLALDPQQRQLGEAEVAVIANACGAADLAQTGYLPLRPIRGQVSYLPASGDSAALRTVLCGEGYLAPAAEGLHSLGATFNLGDASGAVRSRDHRANLDTLANLSPALCGPGWQPGQLEGRVGFRCATPDYLPIVGPVPQPAAFVEAYAALRSNARAAVTAPGRYWPGLYVNVGHGSRGLCYTPLSAELLAGLINAEYPPLAPPLQRALHPARFIIRDLIRNKI